MIIGQQKRNLKAPGFPDFGIFLCSGMNLFTFAGKKAVNIEVIRGMNRKMKISGESRRELTTCRRIAESQCFFKET